MPKLPKKKNPVKKKRKINQREIDLQNLAAEGMIKNVKKSGSLLDDFFKGKDIDKQSFREQIQSDIDEFVIGEKSEESLKEDIYGNYVKNYTEVDNLTKLKNKYQFNNTRTKSAIIRYLNSEGMSLKEIHSFLPDTRKFDRFKLMTNMNEHWEFDPITYETKLKT